MAKYKAGKAKRGMHSGKAPFAKGKKKRGKAMKDMSREERAAYMSDAMGDEPF